MPTVAITILKDDVKKDKTWNVKIRVGHKERSVYIDTAFFVERGQLDKNFKLKDLFVIDRLNPTLRDYRNAIGEMKDLDRLDVKVLKNRLLTLEQGVQINFTEFIRTYIQEKKNKGKDSTAATFVTVLNSLNDYFGQDIDISSINYRFLLKYEAYLMSPRLIERSGNQGVVKLEKKGLTSVHNYMRDLRILFNACRDHYNDDDTGEILIKHYPFKKYKVGQASETNKRGLDVVKLKAIRDLDVSPGSRSELARDLFMLSFYLCGMNAADIYELKPGLVERVEYNRKKVRDRRKDRGFISIKLIPAARDLYLKYAGRLQERYKSAIGLDHALAKGMPEGIDFYAARHSFGDLARNECRFPVDDVAIAMNHIETRNRTTDIYISKNWDIVDEVQAAVVALLI